MPPVSMPSPDRPSSTSPEPPRKTSKFALPGAGLHIRWDLGGRRLLAQWRDLLTTRWLARDAMAGVTVAFVAVPLSMAIALASGVPPAAGLVTAVVAGIVCSIFGGAPLGVSGPAAAMAVLIASVVEEHGMQGLVLAAFVAGALQLLTGATGLGRLARLVPLPVIAGFTAGIGVVIIVGQLPRVLGLPPPDQAHVIDVVTHIGDLIEHADVGTAAIALVTLAIVLVSMRISPLVPSHLLAVVVATVMAVAMGLDIERVGALPDSLFSVPSITMPDDWEAVLTNGAMIWALASLETLLSCNAVDRLAKTPPHDSDQELIGQGLGTIASAALGGIPATSVIARSSLNVAAGAHTRRSALIHGIGVAVLVAAFAPVMALVPVAALAGVLIAVAFGMISPRHFIALWKTSRGEAIVYLITLFAMVAVDLVAGVRVGLLIAFVIAAVRLGRTDARVMSFGETGPYRFTLSGALTFMSLHRIDSLRSVIDDLDPHRGVIMDLRDVSSLDTTAADALAALLEDLQRRGCALAILHTGTAVAEAIATIDTDGRWASRLVPTEADAQRLLGTSVAVAPFDRLVEGVERFRKIANERYRGLFEELASGQSPHTLFVTCSDSRVSPLLVTGAEPGELFVHRNVGNIMPRSGADAMPAEGAAIEYAVGILGVKQIVVCGHSGCGAMNAIRTGNIPVELPSISKWLEDARRVLDRVPPGASVDALARMNVLLQLENLRSYAIVQRKLASGELTLHAWYYEIGRADIHAWDAELGSFVPLARQRPAAVPIEHAEELRAEAG